MVGRVTNDSEEGEDASGSGGELAWKGRWEKCAVSMAVSSAAKSALIEYWVNAKS